jgi:hypothetical protein
MRKKESIAFIWRVEVGHPVKLCTIFNDVGIIYAGLSLDIPKNNPYPYPKGVDIFCDWGD